MKKPSRVIFMALCKTYGLSIPYIPYSSFMCCAIDGLYDKGLINKSEADQAKAAVMDFVYSYDAHATTLWAALQQRGIIEKGISRRARMRVTRRLYIKLVFKLFFKGL